MKNLESVLKFKIGDKIIFNGDESGFTLTVKDIDFKGYVYIDNEGGRISFEDEDQWDKIEVEKWVKETTLKTKSCI